MPICILDNLPGYFTNCLPSYLPCSRSIYLSVFPTDCFIKCFPSHIANYLLATCVADCGPTVPALLPYQLPSLLQYLQSCHACCHLRNQPTCLVAFETGWPNHLLGSLFSSQLNFVSMQLQWLPYCICLFAIRLVSLWTTSWDTWLDTSQAVPLYAYLATDIELFLAPVHRWAPLF